MAPAFEDSAAFLAFSDQAREAVGPGPLCLMCSRLGWRSVPPPGCLSSPLACTGSTVQSCPDPAVYGVVQSGDHVGRTCMVKWFKLRPSGDDVEVSRGRPRVSFRVGSVELGVEPPGSRPPIPP